MRHHPSSVSSTRAPRTRPARWAVAGGAAALALALSGCGVLSGGVYDAPLPGGADVGDHPITVTAEFTNVLDLVPQSSVKVENVAVGRVTDINLSKDGHTAEVEMLVRGDLDLPADTSARLQQTSLLGEKYVALVPPGRADDDAGTRSGLPLLADGAVLSTAETDAAATAEQVFGSLSLVLTGGGLGQFQEISRELQKVSGGREGEVRDFLTQVHRFVGVLDERRSALTTAIDGLARLGATLDGDREQIAHVLDELSPGMQVLVEQRPQLTRMLTALDRLSKVTVRTLDASQKDMVADFKALAPILKQLAEAGTDLPYSLEILLTYPFPDSVLDAVRGDYLNVFITTNFRTLPAGCAAIGCFWPQPGAGTPAARSGRSSRPQEPPPALLPSTDSAVPGLPSPSVPGPSIRPGDSGSTSSSDTGSQDSTAPSDTASSGSPSAPPTSGATTGVSSSPTDPAASEGGE